MGTVFGDAEDDDMVAQGDRLLDSMTHAELSQLELLETQIARINAIHDPDVRLLEAQRWAQELAG